MCIKIAAGIRAILQGIVSCGEIYAGAAGVTHRESLQAGSRDSIIKNAMTGGKIFEMRSLFRHAPDITVPLATPEEGQNRQPQRDIAKGKFSHIANQELFDQTLLHEEFSVCQVV